MTEADILSLLREFLLGAAKISMPLLLAALIVGLIIGLLQALTSIQEMTLTFVPKLGVMLFVFIVTSGYMARTAISLFDNLVIATIAG